MAKQKLTVELGVDNSKFDKGLNDANKKVAGFGGQVGRLGTLLKGAAFAGAITAAFGAVTRVLKTTQEGGDNLAATMRGLGGAAQAAAQSLASADFSVSLKDAYRAAKQLEQVYDDLADRQRSLNVLSSANTLEVARLQGILRNSTKSEQERADAAERIKEIYAEEGRLREQAVNNAIQGEIDALMTKYRISQQEAQAVLDYATNYAKYTKEQQDALNEAMTAQRKLDTYLSNNEMTRDKTVASLKEAASVAGSQVIPEMQQWIDLWRPINDYTDEHRDQVAKLVIDYNNILNTRQRELNMADRINDRMDVQIAKAKEYINLIGGSTAPATTAPQAKGLIDYFGLSSSKLATTSGAAVDGDPYLDRLNSQMEQQVALANEMTAVFSNMFSVMDDGWKAMADALIDSIRRIAAEILAKAAVWAIFALINPGGAIAEAGLGAFLGFSGSGGMSASGVAGLAGGGGNMNLNVVGRLSGSDIVLSSARAGNKLTSNT